jgi:hypothetical protein
MLDALRTCGQRQGRKLRLLACAALRREWHRLTSPSVRTAVEAAERFADGAAGPEELGAARGAAAPEAARMCRSLWFGDEETSRDVWYSVAVHPSGRPLGDIVAHYTSVNSTPRSLFALRTQRAEAGLLRDIFGNPFRPIAFSPEWRTDTALSLAWQMYDSRDFSAMPILADALQDAGCDRADVLDHCRGPGVHVRGCWVVDMVLGKE